METRPTNYLSAISQPFFCDRPTFVQRTAEFCNEPGAEKRVSVVVLDMDRFRTINSALGHDFGYRVLDEIAGRINAAFPSNSAFCHMGNDEFAILLHDQSKARLRALTENALKSIRETVVVDDHTIVVTASVGVASNRRGKHDIKPQDLLQRASIAANEALRNGGNNCVFYTSAVQQAPLRKLDLEWDLRRALAADDIRVYYQPVVDLASQSICGLEALARWKHAELGWIEPAEFIPLAEESGLIAELGEHVLRQACSEIRDLLLSNSQLDYLAVNFAARQVEHRDLVRITERILQQLDFPAEHLVLEITESDFLAAETRIVSSLNALRASGVRIAIDDFGTGYSSLRVLKEFPADVVKIDRLFVQNAHCNHVDATITQAVIDIAHSLDLKVVAEGVENSEQLAFLRNAGSDCVQGFLLGKAVSAAQLPELLANPRLQQTGYPSGQ